MSSMNIPWLHGLPSWVAWPILAAHLLGGIGLGTLYFHGLWWNTRQFAGGARVSVVVALMLGRFAALAVMLWLVSLEGALPLLLAALGILIARAPAIRRVRRAAGLAERTP